MPTVCYGDVLEVFFGWGWRICFLLFLQMEVTINKEVRLSNGNIDLICFICLIPWFYVVFVVRPRLINYYNKEAVCLSCYSSFAAETRADIGSVHKKTPNKKTSMWMPTLDYLLLVVLSFFFPFSFSLLLHNLQ